MRKSAILGIIVIGSLFIVGCTPVTDSSVSQYESDKVTWCYTATPSPEVCFPTVEFDDGQTAYETFQTLDTRQLNFTAEITDLGSTVGKVVVSINQIPADDTHEWKLYYNSKVSDKGLSEILVKDGDKLSYVYSEK